MTIPNNAAESTFRKHVSGQLARRSVEVADRWLAKLEDVVDKDTRDIFPTEMYLDHIPLLIEEIASVIARTDDQLALLNSLIDRKAKELGELRHQQKATVNQLLREYDILSKILEEVVIEETKNFKGEFVQAHGILVMASVSRVVRFILQSTVDAFVENYMATIQGQTDKLVSFNTFVSHELKTPLQAASLNMELLLEDKNPTDEDIMDLIKVQGSIQQAISMLLNIESLIKKNDVVLQDNPVQQQVDLSSLLRDTELLLSETLKDRGVEISFDDDLGRIFVETAKLKLVFTNLLTNAIKYSDPNKQSRWVKISRENSDPDKLTLIIEDNGLGIESEMMKEVFKMRVRAHESLDKENDVTGHGLGLYLVSEAVQDIGGTISLESTVGTGTKVTVSLPTTR